MNSADARAAIAQISSDLNDISAKMALLSVALAAAASVLETEDGKTLDTESGQKLDT